MIDVIDNTRLPVIAALLDASLSNDRIFSFDIAFNWTDVIKAIKQIRPSAATIATPPKDEPRDLSEVPNEQGAELLKRWYGQNLATNNSYRLSRRISKGMRNGRGNLSRMNSSGCCCSISVSVYTPRNAVVSLSSSCFVR